MIHRSLTPFACECPTGDNPSAPVRLRGLVSLVAVISLLAGCGEADDLERASSQTFDRAKQECTIASIRRLARTYGGDPGDPVSVAQAYAEATAQEGVQLDAQNGCLEALDAEIP